MPQFSWPIASGPVIRWAGIVTFPVGYVQPWRRLYDHELVYVWRGEGEAHLDVGAYPATPDTLFLIQPRQRHYFRPGPGSDVTLLGIHFDWPGRPDSQSTPLFHYEGDAVTPSFFREAACIPGWASSGKPLLDLRGKPRIRALLEEVVREHGRPEPESRSAASALLIAAAAFVGRAAREQSLAERHGAGADAVRRAQRARELLETAGETPFTIAEVAAQVGWSADHLRRVFRSVFGATPAAVQNAAQLRFARELLRAGVLPVSEIAFRCGFKTASHFSAAFKTETGLTPREFSEVSRGAGQSR